MDGGSTAARKVMVVADPTRESAAALQYALSHAIVENDILILFHVGNPNAWKINIPFGALFRKPSNVGGGAASTYQAPVAEGGGGGGGAEVNFLDAMKEACVVGKPKLKVVVVKAEMGEGNGKDKASVILAKSAAYKIDLLIVGHKKGLSNSILG